MVPPTGRSRGGRWLGAGPSVVQILSGRAFLRGRLQAVDIAIDEDGRIASVGRIRTGAPRHDVGQSVILPGATDLHVHMREPSVGSAPESIATGTVEAALGGVTLVGDMPNTDPPATSAGRVAEKAARARGRAAVDLLLYALPPLAGSARPLSRAAGAFKLFLSPTTGIAELPASIELPRLLRDLASVDLPLTVHAEDPGLFRTEPEATDPAAWNRCRPPEAEMRAIERLQPAPDRLRLHVAHVTTPGVARRLRSEGRSFEVTAHHLLLSDRSPADARFKVNPPLRSEADRRGLWDMFCQGEVPCLASDHAPHFLEEKTGPFAKAPSGVPGLETSLPVLLAKVRAGELALPTLVAAACDRPARWFGQPLGRIAPGHRANLLVVDFTKRFTVRADALTAPCGWSAFEGWEAIFPREHWKDGVRIVDDGVFVGRMDGAVVRPEFAPGPLEPVRANRTGTVPSAR